MAKKRKRFDGEDKDETSMEVGDQRKSKENVSTRLDGNDDKIGGLLTKLNDLEAKNAEMEARLNALEIVVLKEDGGGDPDHTDDEFLFSTPFLLSLQEDPRAKEVPTLQALFELSYVPGWPEDELDWNAEFTRSWTIHGVFEAIHHDRQRYKRRFKSLNLPELEELRDLEEELGRDLGAYIRENMIPLSYKNNSDQLVLANQEWLKHGKYFKKTTKFHYFNPIRTLHYRFGNEDSAEFIGRLLSHSSKAILSGQTRTANDISDALYEVYNVLVTVGSWTDSNGIHHFKYVRFGIDKYGELCDADRQYTNGRHDDDELLIDWEYDHDGPRFKFA